MKGFVRRLPGKAVQQNIIAGDGRNRGEGLLSGAATKIRPPQDIDNNVFSESQNRRMKH